MWIANLSAGEMRTDRAAMLGELFDLSGPARSRSRRARNCVVRDLVTVLEQAVRHCIAGRIDAGGAKYPAELTVRTDDAAHAAGLSPGTLTALAFTVSSVAGIKALCREFGLPDPFGGDQALEKEVEALLASRHLRTHRMVDVAADTARWYAAVMAVVLNLLAALPHGEIDFYLAQADHMNENRRRKEAAEVYARAGSLCARALAGGQRGVEVHTRRGLALAGIGRASEAVASYDEAIAADPGHALAHLNRGIALAGMGRASEAVASYGEAVRLDAALARAHLSRAGALASLGRHPEALGAYDAAIALGGPAAEAHTDRGGICAALGRDAEALGAYDAAIRTDPYAARAYLKKGQLLRRSGRDGEAAECYGAAIEIDPDGAVAARAHADRGKMAYDAGRLDEALAGCNAAIAIDPGLADAHAGRGNVLAETGCTAEALDSYERALRIDPAHADALAGQSRARARSNGNGADEAVVEDSRSMQHCADGAGWRRGGRMPPPACGALGYLR